MPMTIGERVAAVAVVGAVFIAVTGCISVGNGNGRASATPATMNEPKQEPPVEIHLFADGHLEVGNISINSEQIGTLAEELRGKTVEIVPLDYNDKSVSLNLARTVRDQLLLGGVAKVILPFNERTKPDTLTNG
ncbi:MAG: hypothetical protein QM754_08175 [Tepidisphaeraceae bacterium]